MTPEQKDELLAYWIPRPEGKIMLARAMLNRPKLPFWQVRILAIPAHLRIIWRKYIDDPINRLLWKGKP